MTSRSLVSYDDITAPYVVPTKKRRRNKRSAPPQPAEEDEALDDTTQSRELTHEEIWDDSALVEAWNAAMEEYEAYHGPDKAWKNEPLHKSPLSVFLSLSFFLFSFPTFTIAGTTFLRKIHSKSLNMLTIHSRTKLALNLSTLPLLSQPMTRACLPLSTWLSNKSLG